MVDYIGKIPANSRITLDYNNKKCYFSYPKYTKLIPWKIYRVVYTAFLAMWLNIIALIAIPSGIIYSLFFIPWTEVKTYTVTNYTNPVIGFFVGLISPIALLILSTIFLPPLVLTYLYFKFPKKFREIIPHFGKSMSLLFSGGYYYQMKFNGNGEKIIRIPLFKNVFLDYRTTRDYSKYLEKVKIKELPLMKVNRRGKKKQDIYWYATFEFKESPKSGYLEIDYI